MLKMKKIYPPCFFYPVKQLGPDVDIILLPNCFPYLY